MNINITAMKTFSTSFLVLIFTFAFARVSVVQKPDFSLNDSVKMVIDVENFNYSLLEEAFLVRVNEERYKKNLPVLKETFMLKRAAYDQVMTLADFGTSELGNPGDQIGRAHV